MSSTNRGGIREVSDYYVTPIRDIVKFLVSWEDFPIIGPVSSILDPCAGGDALNEMSYPLALSGFGLNCDTIDIREDSKAAQVGDYLRIDCNDKYDLIITNPPFSLAQEIARKAIAEVRPNGFVVLLLRLNFFGSQKRFSFWQNYPPYGIFVHSQRMSFTGGTTDSIEYMHCIWKKPCISQNVIFKVI